MKVLHLVCTGDIGGIERLCVDISNYSKNDNYFYFVWGGGINASLIREQHPNKVIVRYFKWACIISEFSYLKGYIKRNKIDAILIHNNVHLLLLFGILLKKQINISLYLYAHNNYAYFNGNFALRLKRFVTTVFLKKAYKLCNKMFAISDSVKLSVRTRLGKSDKVVVIYNGVDISRFNAPLIQSSNNTIIFVGRLIKDKGVDLLLNAIKKANTSWNAFIIGDGPEIESLKAKVNDLNIADSVQLVGAQPNIPEWLSKGTVFVHPAILEEGFGITLVEAMASGLPCIAFKKGAIEEVVENGVSGYCLDYESENYLASKLDEISDIIYNEPIEWEHMRQKAILRAKKFDISCMTEKIDYYINEGKI